MDNTRPLQVSELNRLLDLLRMPAPRSIASSITRSAISPIANFLILLGILLAGLSTGLGIMALRLGGARPVVWLALGLEAMASLGLIAWGAASRGRTARLLSTGTLCQGRVLAVSPLPARVNGRSFFRVRADVRHPDGTTATGTDTVDNWAVEYFLDARDQQKEIDVLYSADTPHTVIFPARIANTRRFD